MVLRQLSPQGAAPAAATAAVFLGLAAIGSLLDGFLLSLLTIALLFSFLGSAWNLMMGFAGQLSIGHALFVGIGAYAVGVCSIHYGLSPWVGLLLGAIIAAVVGAAIAWLAFRFEIRGVYFALLTIAFAEFARVMFSGWGFVGATAGLFYPANSAVGYSLAMLRGGPLFFYYVAVGLAALGVAITALVRNSSLGYAWRAIRDDEDAARALGVRSMRHKIGATALSAGMTAVGGGVLGLIHGSLFPDSVMSMSISVDILVGPIVGGLGTVFGPFVGSLVAIPLGHAMNSLGEAAGLPGLNSIAYGVILIAIAGLLPGGLWPAMFSSVRWLQQRLFAVQRRTMERVP